MEVWVEYTTMMHRNGVVRFRCYATSLLMLLMSAFCFVMLLTESFFLIGGNRVGWKDGG